MLAKGKNLTDSDTVIGTSRYKYYNKRYNCMSNITSRIIDSITRITSITSAANIVFSVPKLDTEAGFGKKNNHTQYYKCRITYNCGSCYSSSNY
mgnify:CR=1 FL=1